MSGVDRAPSPKSRELARLTEPDVHQHLSHSHRILVPCGSTEQHGSHAPLGTDLMLAEEVCRRVAPRVGALIAPGIPSGVSGEHGQGVRT